MGWTAHYQILRDQPLSEAEVAALAAYIETSNQPPWECESFHLAVTRDARADRVLGEGLQKLPMEMDESEDHQRLCTTLDGLRAIVPGIEIRISDDFEMFGFDGDNVSTEGDRGEAPVRIPREDRARFAAPSELAPAAHAPVAAETLDAALLALARMDREHPQRAELTARIEGAAPLAVARAGFAQYREVSRDATAWPLVQRALEKLADVQPLAGAFLEVWRNPHGIYWYGDMRFPDATRRALVGVPAVAAQLRADIDASVAGDDSELVHRRAEHAAEWLGLAATPATIATLVAAARALRESSPSTDQRYHTLPGVYRGLATAAVPEAVPTLLLAFEDDKLRNHHRHALEPLAKLAPERAAPIFRHLATTGEALWELVPALALARDATTLRELCRFPIERERVRAGEALTQLGEIPPPLEPLPPPEELVTHPSATIREHAVHAFERANDPATLTSVVAAKVLASAIGRRFGGATGSYGSYFDHLPEDLRYLPHEQQLAALLEGHVPDLPPQIIWPSIQPILDGKAAELAAGYARPSFSWSDDVRAELRAEESAVLATTRSAL